MAIDYKKLTVTAKKACEKSSEAAYCLRWQQFCRIHKLPLDSTEHNHLYITWVQAQWVKWANQNNRPHYRHTYQDHNDFDTYLKNIPEVKNAIS